MRRVFIGALAGVIAAMMAGPALAHAHLEAATPASGATVTAAPERLELTFSEPVELSFTGATLTGPDKAAVATGAVSLAPGEDATLLVPLASPLPPGTYTVDWHALSRDGHKSTGSYTFTVAP